jgi:hypothetical protein
MDDLRTKIVINFVSQLAEMSLPSLAEDEVQAIVDETGLPVKTTIGELARHLGAIKVILALWSDEAERLPKWEREQEALLEVKRLLVPVIKRIGS